MAQDAGEEDTVMTEQCTPVKMPRDQPLRIGFLVNSGFLEAKKCELVSTRRRKPARPWFKGIDKKHVESRGEDPCKAQLEHPRWEPEVGVAVDKATALFMSWKYGDKVKIDMIPAKEVSPERLQENDLNFLMLYDDLEAFHTDRSHGKKVYKRTVATLSGATNVFPPRDYQELINSKINYYRHLMEHDLTICPTICLTNEDYQQRCSETDHDATIQGILAECDEKKWTAVFCKPVFGIESRDAMKFALSSKDRVPLQKQRVRFSAYIKRILNKYPGVVIQKFMQDFGNTAEAPEIRLIFVGKEYQYSVIQTDYKCLRPRQEFHNGMANVPMDLLQEFAAKVIASLPDISIQGVTLPRLITRLDLGWKPDGPDAPTRPFVNEIEYVPSLYVEGPGLHNHLIEKVVGEQAFVITEQFVRVRDTTTPASRARATKARRSLAGRSSSKGKNKRRH